MNIFQYLSIRDLKGSAQACRHFDRVSKDETLWQAFCRRDFGVANRKDRPVWIASWHDYYVYRFKGTIDVGCLELKTDPPSLQISLHSIFD